MNATQANWIDRMTQQVADILDAWHNGSRQRAFELHTSELSNKIAEAARRLGLTIPQAWDPDGWDGEVNAGIETTRRRLMAITMKMNGKASEIPAWWFVSREQDQKY